MAAFTEPIGIAADSSGNLFVTDYTDDKVQKFDSSGTYVATVGSTGSGNGQFNQPFGIACDSNDNVYVIDQSNYRVQKFDNDLVYDLQWGSNGTGDGEFKGLAGISVDRDDEIWVGDNQSGAPRLQRFTAGGVFVSKTAMTGSVGLLFPSCAPDGNIYISTDTTIWKLGSLSLTVFATGFDGGFGSDFFEDLIFVSNFGNSEVVVLDSDGDEVKRFGSAGSGNGEFYHIGSPADVVVVNDSLWVVDKGNDRIQEFSLAVDALGAPGQGETGVLPPDILPPLPTPDTPPGDRDLPYDEEEQTPYTNVGDNYHNVILPHVYGDMTENSDGGAWVAPCIDTVNHVYCAAAWPVLSVANGNVVSCWAADHQDPVNPVNWTFDEDDDYESKGRIATLTFTAEPVEPVTVRMMGKPTTDGGAVLLTNPITEIEDWLDYCTWLLGRASWENDVNNFSQMTARAEANNYKAAGVIQSNNSLGFYLQNILNSFWGSFRFNGVGKLEVFLKSLVDTSNAFETLDEHEAITLSVKKDISQVINRIIIHYAISYSQIDRRFKNGGDPSYYRTAQDSSGVDTTSIRLYGSRKVPGGSLNFDWNRNTISVGILQEALLDAFNDPEFIVTYQGQDFKFMPLEVGDQIQATLSLVRDSDNVIEEDVIYEIREKTTNLDNFTTRMVLYSLNFLDLANTLGGVYIGTDEVFIGADKVYILGHT